MDVGAMLGCRGHESCHSRHHSGPSRYYAPAMACTRRRNRRQAHDVLPPRLALLIFSMEILVRTGGRHERVEPSGPSAALLNGRVGAKK
jgi:hypothetical protein